MEEDVDQTSHLVPYFSATVDPIGNFFPILLLKRFIFSNLKSIFSFENFKWNVGYDFKGEAPLRTVIFYNMKQKVRENIVLTSPQATSSIHEVLAHNFQKFVPFFKKFWFELQFKLRSKIRKIDIKSF